MVVAVEGGVVAGGSDIFGGAFDDDGRVGLREGCRLAGSGLDSAALLVLVFWCRRRSVEEGPRAAARSLDDLVVRIGCCGCCLTCCVGTTCFSSADDRLVAARLRSRGFRDDGG